jgi:2-amino-4-hydroxy-6-hydroxymethyldihydropteridine diphosphokinase
MEQVYLSLGSNIGDRLANLHQAIRALSGIAEISAVSHAYQTEPVEFTAQPWFANTVVALQIPSDIHSDNLSPNESAPDKLSMDAPHRLLQQLLAIERDMGRRRDADDNLQSPRIKGPRIIDLDIVLYGSRVIHTPSLTVPHPAMHQRRFVLQPLAEIAPEVEHPILHQTALQLLRALPEDGPQVRSLAILEWPAV